MEVKKIYQAPNMIKEDILEMVNKVVIVIVDMQDKVDMLVFLRVCTCAREPKLACTGAQNLHARAIFHSRSDLRQKS